MQKKKKKKKLLYTGTLKMLPGVCSMLYPLKDATRMAYTGSDWKTAHVKDVSMLDSLLKQIMTAAR